MTLQPVYFVHISDTHIGPEVNYQRHGHYPFPCARRAIELIKNLPTRPDFVIHTGDVASDPQPAAFRLAAELFSELNIPIYYVNGNHDRADLIRRFLPMGPKVNAGSDSRRLAYTFEAKGHRFLTLDGRGPDEIDPHGFMDDSQLELLAQELERDGPPLVIFVHFPALPLNSPWMDDNMLIVNGHEFHELLARAGQRVRAVFHGHIHRPFQTLKDGILYVSGASVFAQFSAWPWDNDVEIDAGYRPGYGFVHLLPERIIIHQHTFSRPAPIAGIEERGS